MSTTGHGLAEILVATIDQISWDILVSHGHEIGCDMHHSVSLPLFLNPFTLIWIQMINLLLVTILIGETREKCWDDTFWHIFNIIGQNLKWKKKVLKVVWKMWY